MLPKHLDCVKGQDVNSFNLLFNDGHLFACTEARKEKMI